MDKQYIKALANQPGGTVRIPYKDNIIYAPKNLLESCLRAFKENADERGKCVAQAEKHLTWLEPMAKANMLPDHHAQQYMHDVVIWFANEIAEGRAHMEANTLNYEGEA